MYIDNPLREYLKDLAARKPAPGGGSAAALTAATGAALMSMVANYTIGNPKYSAVEKEAGRILASAEKYRAELEKLIDEDVAAYAKLSQAIREKRADMESAYQDAVQPPFSVCKICAQAMEACAKLVDIGNRNLVTDTAIAAILFESAFFSAKFNVYINLKYSKDTGSISKIHGYLSPLEQKMPALKEQILEKCEEVIK